MGLGYEGYALLDNEIFLCTGAEAPESMQKMESSSGYGGKIKTPVSEIGLFSPLAYDWPTYDGSINFDLTSNFYIDRVKPWIFDRGTSKELKLYPRYGTAYTVEELWWTSINIAGTAGGALTGSIGFMGVSSSTGARDADYIGNKQGNANAYAWLTTGKIPALNPSGTQLNPIPFWKSHYTSSPSIGGELINWSVTFNQTIQKFFKCEGNTTTQPPFIVGIGPMTATLELEIFYHTGSLNINEFENSYPQILSQFNLYIDSTLLTLKNLQLQNDTDAIKSGSELSTVSLGFDIYELSA